MHFGLSFFELDICSSILVKNCSFKMYTDIRSFNYKNKCRFPENFSK